MVSTLAYQKDEYISNQLFLFESQPFAIILIGGNKVAEKITAIPITLRPVMDHLSDVFLRTSASESMTQECRRVATDVEFFEA
jgi:hypothetical protein